jgi:hypothetical protein
MKKSLRVNLDEQQILDLKIKALHEDVNVNEILEKLIEKYLKGEVEIEIKK